jgi:hypothetical protein
LILKLIVLKKTTSLSVIKWPSLQILKENLHLAKKKGTVSTPGPTQLKWPRALSLMTISALISRKGISSIEFLKQALI